MWLVAGGRLSQYCSWMEAATGLSHRRNACVGRNQMVAGLYTQYTAPPCLLGCGSKLVRSELAHVLMDVTPQICMVDAYLFVGLVSQPGAGGLMFSALFPTHYSSSAPKHLPQRLMLQPCTAPARPQSFCYLAF